MLNKLKKAFHKQKQIYAYENCNGDKGIIIADSLNEAEKLFKEQYSKRNIAHNDEEFYDNGTYLFEESPLEKNSKLYCPFPW